MRIGVSAMLVGNGVHPADLGRALEERGFESLFVGEHGHLPVRPEEGRSDADTRRNAGQPDPFVLHGVVAGATRHLVLGFAVLLLAQRDPILTAKEIATLDALSGGRVVVGVGSGWNRGEMRNHGTDPATRVAVLRESVRAMEQIWTHDQAEFHGTYVDFDPIYSWPKPVQQPRPPILVGGGLGPAWPKVRDYGDGWLAVFRGDLSTMVGDVATFRRQAAEAGRPDLAVTVSAVPAQQAAVDALAEAGANRVLLDLPRTGPDETLRLLDRFAMLTKAPA